MVGLALVTTWPYSPVDVFVGAFNIGAYMSEAIRGSIESVKLAAKPKSATILGLAEHKHWLSYCIASKPRHMIDSFLSGFGHCCRKKFLMVSIISVVWVELIEAQTLVGSNL